MARAELQAPVQREADAAYTVFRRLLLTFSFSPTVINFYRYSAASKALDDARSATR